MNDKKQENQMTYAVPVAIIIAGIFVAGAILYSGSDSTGITENRDSDSNDPVVVDTAYAGLAKSVGADVLEYKACMEDFEVDDKVDRDAINAFDTGGTGTPWSLVVTESGSIIPINGNQPYSVVSQTIESAISDQERGVARELEDPKHANVRPVSEIDHIYGNPNAKVTVIEYSDFECPFCQGFHPTVKRAVNEYEGEVNWVYRHLPLETIHPNAREMARASECVARVEGNDAFWQFTDKLFAL